MNADIQKKNRFINYPMLLLALYILLNIRGYISSFIGFFKSIFQNPLGIVSNLLGLVLSFFTVILLVLLVLNLMKKLENGNRIIGVVIIVAEVFTLYYSVLSIIKNISMFSNFVFSPIVTWIVNIFISIFVIWSGLLIFKGKTPSKGFTALFWIVVYIHAIEAALAAAQYNSSIMNIVESVIYVILFYHLPNLFNESTIEKTAITKKKITALVIIVAILLGLFAITDSAVHGGSSKVDTSVCRSCGRSWEAGDAGGNYKNIARTGMCNNCENNYHSLKEFLD